jgi:tungstate transport system substrate-binding protein
VLLPRFEAAHGIRVKPIAVGTGEALAMGARGDADVLLVHSRKAEDEFMQQGHGSLRLDVMHNDFLLMGPAADPAGAKGKGVLEALKLIAASASPFVSRADQSGTHKKELELWAKAGVATEGAGFVVRTGQGMGESARVASEKRAYTLIDRATYLAQKKTLELVPIAEGEPALFNPYGVIVVSAAKHPKVHEADATTFARWLCTPEVQKLIGEFGVDKYGGQLYVPDAVAAGAK